jgi:hypothetical protein
MGHLRGDLSAAEEADLTAHLDGCPACQETVEALAGAGDSLLRVARQVGQDPESEETALHHAIAAAQRRPDGGSTHAEPTAGGADEFPYLGPPAEPGQLGRLAHYAILEVVGRGGMGIVFRALDERLQRVVAIKVLGPQYAASGNARERFRREAKAAAAVSHDHVVPIYHVDEAGGVSFLVMPLIAGRSLQERIDQDGPLRVEEILRIGMQVAAGLAAAHKLGLVHRDIKPANILLENGVERVKITDFGLARAVDAPSVTQSGVITGTPMFMSPEQARGDDVVDHRSDLFSLGSVLYMMATGRAPFRASSTMGVLRRVCEQSPPPLREANPAVPDWLEAIVAKLHAKRPEDRFQSAQEVADLLGAYLAHLQQPRRVPLPAPIRRPRAAARVPRPVLIMAIVCITLFFVVALGLPLLVILLYMAAEVPPPAGPVAAVEAVAPPMNAGPAVNPAAVGWQPLFNGKDLAGWKTHPEQPGGWTVKDGVLVGTGGPTHLFTERGDFEDFHLRAEVKISPRGDSGLCFRSDFGFNQFKSANGYEAQIGDAHRYKTGSLWGARGPFGPTDSKVPADTWFTYEVIARGPRLTLKVNGKTTVDVLDQMGYRRKGHVALQAFSAETHVEFRSVLLQELPKQDPAARDLYRFDWGEVFDLTGLYRFAAEPGRLTIAASTGDRWDDLIKGNFTAPRLLREVKGDFSAVVKVLPFDAKGPDAYLGGGLVLWHDNNTFLRYLVARNPPVFGPGPHAHLRVESDGNTRLEQFPPLKDDQRYLNLERRGNTCRVRWGADGKTWGDFVTLPDMNLPPDVRVGLLVLNKSKDADPSVQFEDFRVEPLPPAVAAEVGWVPLFKDKHHKGWMGLLKCWKVQDGQLVGSSLPDGVDFNTFLCSERDYKDFELKFKVRVKGDKPNSGVQIRSTLTDPGRMTVVGPQCDIGETFWGNLFQEGPGSRTLRAAPAGVMDMVRPDDFNDYYIRCAGRHVTIKVNGFVTVDDDVPELPASGVIAWQIHRGAMEVVFRDVWLKDLSPP